MKITDVAKSADAQNAADSAVKVRPATEQIKGGPPKKKIATYVQSQIAPQNKAIGVGKQGRSELSAVEKIQMLDRIHEIQKDCQLKIPEDSEHAASQRSQMVEKLASQEMPYLDIRKLYKKLLHEEDYWCR